MPPLYHCHKCNQRCTVEARSNGALRCTRCNEGFVEDISDDAQQEEAVQIPSTSSTANRLIDLANQLLQVQTPHDCDEEEEEEKDDEEEEEEKDDEEEEESDDEISSVGIHLQKLHSYNAVGHTGSILSLHAIEGMMISGSKDRSANVWDLETSKRLMTLGNHPNNVNFVHLSPDKAMALTSSLNIVKVWDLRSPCCIHHLNSMGIVNEGLNMPCNRTTAMQETDIRAAVDPQQPRFLFTTCKNGIRVWDLQRMEHIGLLDDPSGNDIKFLAVQQTIDNQVSPSENSLYVRVASVAANNNISDKLQTVAVEISCGSPQIVTKYPQAHDGFHQMTTADEGLITSLCFSPKALYASQDLNLMRFSMQNLNRNYVQPFAHDQEAMCPLSHSCEGENKFLVTGSSDGTLKVWDVGSTEKIHPVETLASAPELNTMCANSILLFTGSSDNTVGYWKIV